MVHHGTVDYELTKNVDAPAERVWDLFVDLERWPQMTKSISEVRRLQDGPLQVGSQADVKQPGLPRARWQVTDLNPGRSFTWQTSTGGVSTAGTHIVEGNGSRSEITLSLHQHGPMAWLAGVLYGRRARRYLTMEIEGFRYTAESRTG
jgi:uncharacterized membrane protein